MNKTKIKLTQAAQQLLGQRVLSEATLIGLLRAYGVNRDWIDPSLKARLAFLKVGNGDIVFDVIEAFEVETL